jgi:hypothetical protein
MDANERKDEEMEVCAIPKRRRARPVSEQLLGKADREACTKTMTVVRYILLLF